MLNRRDYLFKAVEHKLHHNRNWILKAFTVTKPEDPKESPVTYTLRVTDFEYQYYSESFKWEPIIDAKPKEPLFSFRDRILITKENIPTLQVDSLDTSIGTFLFNHIALLGPFKGKFPYIAGKINIKDVENQVASKLQDTPKNNGERSNEFYYVDEYLEMANSIRYLRSFSDIISYASTKKGILPPTGIREFKQKLDAKYANTLSDPVQLAQYEKELKDFDDAYLKDDPAYGNFLSGKITGTARKEMFLAVGAGGSFDNKPTVTAIPESLIDGWSTDPEKFEGMMNTIRQGSYSRGMETVKGGVTAKNLLRAADNFKIIEKDCESKLGLSREYTKSTIDQAVGRYVITSNGPVLITEDSKASYLNKKIRIRSPMYCREQGEQICSICSGARLAQFPTGISIPLTDVSAVVLTAALKAMHDSGVKSNKMNIEELIT